jgi:hypothetical protein
MPAAMINVAAMLRENRIRSPYCLAGDLRRALLAGVSGAKRAFLSARRNLALFSRQCAAA